MNANEIVFRASSMDSLMTNGRGKTEVLGETAKKELVKVYAMVKYGRVEEITSKYLTKGNEREEDAITLVSRYTKKFFKKNTTRLSNSFLSGEVDIYLGESVEKADEIFDTKCSWSLQTFLNAKGDDYKEQMVSYMALTGAKKATVAFCLVNSTEQAINDEKRKVGYLPGMLDAAGNSSLEFIERCKQIEINHIFDIEAFKKEYPWFEFANEVENWKWDIPMDERVKLFEFPRIESEITALYERVKECRAFMNSNLFK